LTLVTLREWLLPRRRDPHYLVASLVSGLGFVVLCVVVALLLA
jgi:hypothetical protein